MTTTKKIIQELGLYPALDWQQGWKVVSRYVDHDSGKVSYTSYCCPRPLAYKVGYGTTKCAGDGPLTGFHSLDDVEAFAEYEMMGWEEQAVFRMLYTPYTETAWKQGGIYCTIWQRITDEELGRFLRSKSHLVLPAGTVFAQTIVIYGGEVR
jgi:hypothetical protein